MRDIRTRIRPWQTLTWWTLASFVGWVTGMAMGALVTMLGSRLFGLNEDRGLVYAMLLSVGLACGAAQSRILRGYLPGAWRWIPGTLGGYLLVMVLFVVASGAKVAISDPITFVVVGAAISIPQWLLLRRYFRGTGLWVLASAAGFLSFLWLAGNPAGSLGEFIAVGAILGALAAVPPGILIVGMVRHPQVAIS